MLKNFTQRIVVVVVHFYDVDCSSDGGGLPTASERLYSEASCIEGMDDCWSDSTCYLGELVKCISSMIGWLTPATVTLLIERQTIVSRNAVKITKFYLSRTLT